MLAAGAVPEPPWSQREASRQAGTPTTRGRHRDHLDRAAAAALEHIGGAESPAPRSDEESYYEVR